MEQFCKACHSRSVTTKKCASCNYARYCDQKCQKQDWKIHKLECADCLLFNQTITKIRNDVEFCSLLHYVACHYAKKNDIDLEIATIKPDGENLCVKLSKRPLKKVKQAVSELGYRNINLGKFDEATSSIMLIYTMGPRLVAIGRIQTLNNFDVIKDVLNRAMATYVVREDGKLWTRFEGKTGEIMYSVQLHVPKKPEISFRGK